MADTGAPLSIELMEVGQSGKEALFNSAVQTINDMIGGGYSNEQAQDAVGGMVDTTLVYTDGTPLLSRAALTGDVTASGGSNSTTIANDAVTFAKMQNIATDSLIGRDTASTGDPENILLNATLSMDGAGNLQRAALTGDVTASAGSNSTTIANDAVSYAKMQNVSATDTVLGRSTLGAGDVEEIACTSAGRALIDDADASAQRTTLGLGTIATVAAPSGTVVGTSDTQTLTNKRLTARVVSMADATSFTPTGDTADINTHANTQGVGTLTANAPSGTPTDGQRLVLRIKSTNVQTYSWNAIYRGSVDLTLPTASSGATLTDYYLFIYNSADSKWDYLSRTGGF